MTIFLDKDLIFLYKEVTIYYVKGTKKRMRQVYLGKDPMRALDELIMNLVGFRTDCHFLPDETVYEILNRAKHDLIMITEVFTRGNE